MVVLSPIPGCDPDFVIVGLLTGLIENTVDAIGGHDATARRDIWARPTRAGAQGRKKGDCANASEPLPSLVR